jgi:hypothetical protein
LVCKNKTGSERRICNKCYGEYLAEMGHAMIKMAEKQKLNGGKNKND